MKKYFLIFTLIGSILLTGCTVAASPPNPEKEMEYFTECMGTISDTTIISGSIIRECKAFSKRLSN